MTVKLLAEQHLEFLSLKGGCTGSSEYTLVKMPHCWKSHVVTHFCIYSMSCRTHHFRQTYKYLGNGKHILLHCHNKQINPVSNCDLTGWKQHFKFLCFLFYLRIKMLKYIIQHELHLLVIILHRQWECSKYHC